ncbi:MAG: hypothetical protein RRZ34_00355 [Malacoplasma sp.]
MKLSRELLNKWVKIIDMNGNDFDIIKKLNNIGMKKGTSFYILYISHNNKMVHIVLNQIEYAFRLHDLAFIELEDINGEQLQVIK